MPSRKRTPSRNRALPYDEALAQQVLGRIEAGVMLRDLWRDPKMPTRGDLRRWRHADPRFEARVRAAVNAARSRRMLTLTKAVTDEIYLRLCAGESLPAICADPGMPGVATVYEWLRRDKDFASTYALGREIQGWTLVDQAAEAIRTLIGLTDKAEIDAIDHTAKHLRWRTAKLAAKKYGQGG